MTPIQWALDRRIQYCKENDMKVNGHKTKVAIFNTSKKYDLMPQLTLDGRTKLEVVEKFRLLDVIFQKNLG